MTSSTEPVSLVTPTVTKTAEALLPIDTTPVEMERDSFWMRASSPVLMPAAVPGSVVTNTANGSSVDAAPGAIYHVTPVMEGSDWDATPIPVIELPAPLENHTSSHNTVFMSDSDFFSQQLDTSDAALLMKFVPTQSQPSSKLGSEDADVMRTSELITAEGLLGTGGLNCDPRYSVLS